jgi:predicted enzyme related to lactoylglutathione lyase
MLGAAHDALGGAAMTLRVGEIVIDCSDHDVVVGFWLAAFGEYERHDVNEQYVAIAPREREAGRPTLLFQKVPEPKVVKNRVHLDLRGDSMADEVERLRGLGATFVAERSLGASVRWTVMQDPEGNEFCVSGS